MQVAKWGNSLAVRLPASVVDALHSSSAFWSDALDLGRRAFHV